MKPERAVSIVLLPEDGRRGWTEKNSWCPWLYCTDSPAVSAPEMNRNKEVSHEGEGQLRPQVPERRFCLWGRRDEMEAKWKKRGVKAAFSATCLWSATIHSCSSRVLQKLREVCGHVTDGLRLGWLYGSIFFHILNLGRVDIIPESCCQYFTFCHIYPYLQW